MLKFYIRTMFHAVIFSEVLISHFQNTVRTHSELKSHVLFIQPGFIIKKINLQHLLQKHFSMGINYFHFHSISSPLSITSVFYYLLSKQKPALHGSIQSGCFKYSYVATSAHILQHLPQMFSAKDESMVFSLECKCNESTFANQLITVKLLFSYCGYIHAIIRFLLNFSNIFYTHNALWPLFNCFFHSCFTTLAQQPFVSTFIVTIDINWTKAVRSSDTHM